MSASTLPRLTNSEILALDPYAFMAVIGKRVIHPGGRRSTEEVFARAAFQAGHEVLDVGCGVGTTAVAIARRFGCRVTAVDIAPLMLDRARATVRAAGLTGRIAVQRGDILALDYPDDTFDRVVAEAVAMFVDRPRAARELVRVCRPGGRVLTTEFLWRTPPPEARQVFLGEVCPGLTFDTRDDWVRVYEGAGLRDVQVTAGPFAMMTPAGFLAIMARVLTHPTYLKKMAWLLPRMQRAVPFLGYLTVSGTKPT